MLTTIAGTLFFKGPFVHMFRALRRQEAVGCRVRAVTLQTRSSHVETVGVGVAWALLWLVR